MCVIHFECPPFVFFVQLPDRTLHSKTKGVPLSTLSAETFFGTTRLASGFLIQKGPPTKGRPFLLCPLSPGPIWGLLPGQKTIPKPNKEPPQGGFLSALLRPKGRLAAAFRCHGAWGLWPQAPVIAAVRAKHPTGVYLRGTRLQGDSLDPFGTVTYGQLSFSIAKRK